MSFLPPEIASNAIFAPQKTAYLVFFKMISVVRPRYSTRNGIVMCWFGLLWL